MYLKEKPNKSTLSFGNFFKQVPKYCAPFEVLAKKGSVAYELALPPSKKVHNLFHVSLLKQYVHDSTHVIDWSEIKIEPEGKFQTENLHILDMKEFRLPNRVIVEI